MAQKVASARRAPEKKSGTFTTSTGLEITISRVDPMFLQKVINSVQFPKRPTYEITTISGRKETHVMDEASAKETEGGEEIWEQYTEEHSRALQLQNDRTMSALFYSGTSCEVPAGAWVRKWEFLGVDVPDDPDERRVFYLTSELPAEDMVALMSAVLELTGVNPEVLKTAEDAFRGAVSDGQGNVSESGADTGETAQDQLAA